MKSIILKLIIISISLPSLCQAQRYIDHFDPDNIRLARLAWDDSLDQETINWLQACVDTAHHEIRLWALHVMGVHLEQMPAIIDRSQHWEQFQKNLIGHLNTAKQKTNIDSTLISLIDTTDLVTHHSHRGTMSHFLFDIVADRQVRQIRKTGRRTQDLNNIKFVEKFGSDYDTYYLAIATKSDKEILRLADSLFNIKEENKLRDSPLGWALITYRGKFLKDFEKYYQPTKFNHLSPKGQATLLHYWSFNKDLINAKDKVKILKLLKIKPSDKTETNLIIQKVLLRSLILNRSKEEYSNEIHEMFNSEENERYKEKTRQRVLAQNPMPTDTSKRSTSHEQKVVPGKSGHIRPEELVTMFNNCTEGELLEYLEQNLNIELYRIPGSKKIQEVINIRAAILMLGNMYYSENEIHEKQSRYDSLVKKLVTIGTLDMNGYGEATTLIYYLGIPSISFLKAEFFNQDLNRVQFAVNKLIEMKNLDVVNWMIRVIETNPDPDIQKRALSALKIMKTYRNLHTPNSGITKEESDRIAREVIEPYLRRN